MRISDWSSDVCSSDLAAAEISTLSRVASACAAAALASDAASIARAAPGPTKLTIARRSTTLTTARSEEHTSELQSLMRISYAVFCLKKKNYKQNINSTLA